MIKNLTPKYKQEILERMNRAFIENFMYKDWKEI